VDIPARSFDLARHGVAPPLSLCLSVCLFCVCFVCVSSSGVLPRKKSQLHKIPAFPLPFFLFPFPLPFLLPPVLCPLFFFPPLLFPMRLRFGFADHCARLEIIFTYLLTYLLSLHFPFLFFPPLRLFLSLLFPFPSLPFPLPGWLDSRVVSVPDSGAEGPGFKSQPRRCRVTALGKLFTPIVPLFTKQQNW